MKRFNCEEVITRLRTYFEGKLAKPEELEIDDHLDHCKECRSKLEALLESEEGLQPTPQEEVQILRWLRADYDLDPDRERKGIKEILAKIQRFRSKSAEML